MKSVTIPSIGNPGTFSPLSSGDPTFYTEAASFDARKLFWDLNQAGYVLSQPETSDVDAVVTWLKSVHTAISGFINDFLSWLGSGGTYPTEPNLPALPSNYDFFYPQVLAASQQFYGILSDCRKSQVLVRIEQAIKDSNANEGILSIGDVRVWSKSEMVDAL
jgi:hypothetical protein